PDHRRRARPARRPPPPGGRRALGAVHPGRARDGAREARSLHRPGLRVHGDDRVRGAPDGRSHRGHVHDPQHAQRRDARRIVERGSAKVNWLPWALGSAGFAGLTAILAKVGVKDVDSDFATAIRTTVILVFAWTWAGVRGVVLPGTITSRTWIFLVLS